MASGDTPPIFGLRRLQSCIPSPSSKSIASRERRLTGDVFRLANFWFWPARDLRLVGSNPGFRPPMYPCAALRGPHIPRKFTVSGWRIHAPERLETLANLRLGAAIDSCFAKIRFEVVRIERRYLVPLAFRHLLRSRSVATIQPCPDALAQIRV